LRPALTGLAALARVAFLSALTDAALKTALALWPAITGLAALARIAFLTTRASRAWFAWRAVRAIAQLSQARIDQLGKFGAQRRQLGLQLRDVRLHF
jgi:hypothetical protein